VQTAPAALFPLLVRTGSGAELSEGAEDVCVGINSPVAAELFGLHQRHCSNFNGSLGAAGSGPAWVLMQQINHIIKFFYSCDIETLLQHHCLS